MNRVIGVDFGTSNTTAVIEEKSQTSLVPDFILRSSIAIDDPTRGVRHLDSNPDNGFFEWIVNSKLTLLVDPEPVMEFIWQEDVAHATTKLDPVFEVNEVIHRPEGWRRVEKNRLQDQGLSEESLQRSKAAGIAILKELQTAVNGRLGQRAQMDEQDAFIFGVPALTYHYRALLKTLAVQAGWPLTSDNFRVFPEPYAVLLDLAHDDPHPGTYLIIDAGGGTTDWALVRVAQESFGPHFQLLATYRQQAAGNQIDWQLAQQLLGASANGTLTAGDLHRIESEKIRVSVQDPGTSARIVLNGREHTLTWDHLVVATQQVFDPALADGREHFREQAIDAVMLTGGASQSPGFRDCAAKHFGSLLAEVPSYAVYRCSRGLTIAHRLGILSGLEQAVSYVEIPSQVRTTWLNPFEPLSAEVSDHDQRFIFKGDQRHIPLFFEHNREWVPAGYLSVSEADVTIRPVWTGLGLEFHNSAGQPILWQNQPFPYLKKNMPVAYANNQLSGQSASGHGVVKRFTGSYQALDSWTGNMETVSVVLWCDAHATVKVKTSTSHWQHLSIPWHGNLLTPRDFPNYPATPMAPLELSAFTAEPLDGRGSLREPDEKTATEASPAFDSKVHPLPHLRLGRSAKTGLAHRLRDLETRIEALEHALAP